LFFFFKPLRFRFGPDFGFSLCSPSRFVLSLLPRRC
jgi:hypothetical protein